MHGFQLFPACHQTLQTQDFYYMTKRIPINFDDRFEIYLPQRCASIECKFPNFSDAIVSLHLYQIPTTFESVILNFIDRFINEGMSDVLRSLPFPVDEDIPIKVFLCVVRHDYFTALGMNCTAQSKESIGHWALVNSNLWDLRR